MDTIYTLMECIFPIYIMENFPDTALSWNNNCFFIIFITIMFLNVFRPYEKGINTILGGVLFVTTSCANHCHLPQPSILHPIGAEFLNQFFYLVHCGGDYRLLMISSSWVRRRLWRSTIWAMRWLSSSMSMASRVSGCST